MTIRLTALALILALAAIPAHAGGPVITEEEPLVAGDTDEKRVNPLVILVGLLLIGALVSGGGDDPAPVTPAPEPQPDPGPKPCVYEGGGGC